LQLIPPLLEKTCQTFAPDLLFTLDDEGQIARQLRSGFQICLNGFQVREVLAFVVTRAAREKRPSFDARLEWRSFPEFKRLWWLDVIMAINEKARARN
jgi:hypothetical protein